MNALYVCFCRPLCGAALLLSAAEGNEVATNTNGFSGASTWISIGAAALAAIVIIALVLRARKKKSAPGAEHIPDEPEARSTEEMPTVQEYAAPETPGRILIGNAHHIGNREEQQDSFGVSDLSNEALLREKGLLAVVADGMGGLDNGAEISSIVTQSMLHGFAQQPGRVDPAYRLLALVEDANARVNQHLDGSTGSGSTVVATLIHQGKLLLISVGDSRIYLHRNGVLLQLNREHVYGAELDGRAARGEMLYADALGDRQRKALTSYIGMGGLAAIDRTISPIVLCDGDKILLMTDGVYGTLADDEIATHMGLPAYEAAAKVETAVLEKQRKYQDNFTLIVLEYHQ